MLKRLVGVITVKDGWAVQSIGYDRYLPLGRPEILAENLDRWFLDEILVSVIDRSCANLGPDIGLVERIADRCLMTPLTYGGGISTADQARALVKAGADRLCLEAAFEDLDHKDLAAIRDAVGVQAVLRALPIEQDGHGAVCRYDYRSRSQAPLDVAGLVQQAELFSELVAIDRRGEGGMERFDPTLLTPFEDKGLQIVAFGGITTRDQTEALLARDTISAVAIGNSLNYREIANRSVMASGTIDDTRQTSYGDATRGAREW